MSIIYNSGNIFDSEAEALVNPVNCVGVMGKGLALQFKQRFPSNYEAYKYECSQNNLKIGLLFCYEENSKLIINFPTKTHWKQKSELQYIDKGLIALQDLLTKIPINSIAIPPLGCGLGGLNWTEVKPLIFKHMVPLTGISVHIYQP